MEDIKKRVTVITGKQLGYLGKNYLPGDEIEMDIRDYESNKTLNLPPHEKMDLTLKTADTKKTDGK